MYSPREASPSSADTSALHRSPEPTASHAGEQVPVHAAFHTLRPWSAGDARQTLLPAPALALQRTLGNRAVQQLLTPARTIPGSASARVIQRDAESSANAAPQPSPAQANDTLNGPAETQKGRPECHKHLEVPPGESTQPGMFQHMVIPPPDGPFNVTELRNDGTCELAIVGYDKDGHMIQPALFLAPGQTAPRFTPPAGTVTTGVMRKPGCSGTGLLSYGNLCNS